MYLCVFYAERITPYDGMLLCILEVMEVVLEVLGDVEGGLRSLEILEVPEVMYCVLLCMMEAVEGKFSFEVRSFK
jgi:hypothetical protein